MKILIDNEAKKIFDEQEKIKKTLKELANNENKYYFWIIQYCLEFIALNNPNWFGGFSGTK